MSQVIIPTCQGDQKLASTSVLSCLRDERYVQTKALINLGVAVETVIGLQHTPFPGHNPYSTRRTLHIRGLHLRL